MGADDADLDGVTPGDTVKLGSENGEDVMGTVFLMSGGGNGPSGKHRMNYKSELAVLPSMRSDGCSNYLQRLCRGSLPIWRLLLFHPVCNT